MPTFENKKDYSMEVGNLGIIRLDQLNSHGSYIIKQIYVLLN